ncbi:Cuticle protein 6 [Portunus trituberculatus]|uniref:Cuticle protein 6 n=2 Tax=Portunus trituberculatus TaxID=210409 RepID=A0A5B7ESJ9_PORTR|nr:Cuticle protein 6 [Portunus trituberculatus]
MQQEATVQLLGNMKLLVILAVVASCKAQLILPVMGPMQQRIETPTGPMAFMFTDWNQNRQEMQLGGGNVVGQYSYIDPNGKPVVTYYSAGRHGFKVSSNNLPEAPALSPNFKAPEPVKDTPEVAEAKQVMADLHKAATSRTKRQAVARPLMYSVNTNPWMYSFNTHATPYASYNPFYSSLMNPTPFMPATSWITNQPAIEAVKKSRKRREADPLMPLMYSMTPAVVRTKQLTPVEGDTPADTTQLKMTTVEHKVPMAAMPVMSAMGWPSARPITYSLMNPAILPINI